MRLLYARYGFRSKPELVLFAKPWVGEHEVNLSPLTDWIEKKLAVEFQVRTQWLFSLTLKKSCIYWVVSYFVKRLNALVIIMELQFCWDMNY